MASSSALPADNCPRRSPNCLLWKLRVRACTLTDIRKLFGQELLHDVDKLQRAIEPVHLLEGQLKSEDGRRALQAIQEQLARLISLPSDAQRTLQTICEKMNFQSQTTQTAGSGSPHAVIEVPIADELGAAVRGLALREEHILVSPQYRDLVDALLSVRLDGKKRQPEVKEEGQIPLATISPVDAARARCISLQDALLEEDVDYHDYIKALTWKRDDSQYDEIEIMSFSTRKTHSTGDVPNGVAKSWGKGVHKHFKPKMVKPSHFGDAEHGPSYSAEDFDHATDADPSIADGIPRMMLLQEVARLLEDQFGVQLSGDQLRRIFAESRACIATTISESDDDGTVFDLPYASASSTAGDVHSAEEFVRTIKMKKCPVVKNSQSFRQFINARIHHYVDKVVLPFLHTVPLEIKLVDDSLPLEAVEECRDTLVDAARACLKLEVLSHCFVPEKMEKLDSRSTSGLLRACQVASQHFIKLLSQDIALKVQWVPLASSQHPMQMREVVQRSLKEVLLADCDEIAEKAWEIEAHEFRTKKASLAQIDSGGKVKSRSQDDTYKTGKAVRFNDDSREHMIEKEGRERENKFTKEWKGGRNTVITCHRGETVKTEIVLAALE